MMISICLITYKRPQGLRRVLEGLNALTFDSLARPEIEVIVVDNDNNGLAAEICAEIRPSFNWVLKDSVEAQRGITFARNKSVSLISAESDFVAILDDDEIPESSWLENLVLAQQKFSADIVTGPVVPYFSEQGTPDWVVEGNFFAPPRFETGEQREVAFTNNVLVKSGILRRLNPVFDNRFAISGGSDAFLFLTLSKAGYKIVWADNAIVADGIPSSRTNLKWILFRGYRTWGNYSAYEKELYPAVFTQIVRMLKGFALIVIGLVKLFPSLLFGKASLAKSLLTISRGMGTLGGLLGFHYQEYKHTQFVIEKGLSGNGAA